MQRRLGIARTLAVASIALVVVVVVEFVLLVLLIASLRESSRSARKAEDVIGVSNRLEKALLDLETGQRGFAITGKKEFLVPWTTARRKYPALAVELEELVAGDPEQEARARDIAARVSRYERTWTDRIVALARRDLVAARALIATGRGKAQVDQLRRRFNELNVSQRAFADKHRAKANRLATVAIGIGVAALAGTLALVGLYFAFIFTFIVAPLNRLAATTRRMARGDLAARAAEERGHELDELATEFNAMGEALALRRAELEAVLDSTTDGLLMADLGGRVIFVNAAMDTIWASLGLTQRGPVWERLDALARLTAEPHKYGEVFARLADDPRAEFADEFSVPTQGRSFVGRTAPVRGADDQLLGRIFILREVTRERESERLKDEFIATVSHELRTPLTSIRGFAELLLADDGGGLSTDQRRFLSVVDRNADRLLRLVGDLLLIAQLDAHTLRLELQDVDIGDVAAEAVEAARPAAEEAGLRLEVLLDDAPLVHADRARLGQLLDNLVSNAIKFTPSGGFVEVATALREGSAVVSVRDTGPGLAPAEIDDVFERFYRAPRASREQIPGTGLGLAISKAIAEAHGGAISVESAEGAGATFTLTLPAQRS